MPSEPLTLAQVLVDEQYALDGKELRSEVEHLQHENAKIDNTKPEEVKHDEIYGHQFENNFAKLGLNGDDLPKVYRMLNGKNRSALCLSGGGIRSAALSLGIVQRFAAEFVNRQDGNRPRRLLEDFNFLSTVSGGGYLGSWLSAWLYRGRVTNAQPGAIGIDVPTELNRRDPPDMEADPITNLRCDSLYLAPKFHAFSADVWADVACVVRNLLLNWFVILPPILLFVLSIQLVVVFFSISVPFNPVRSTVLFSSLIVASLVPMTISLGATALSLPTRDILKSGPYAFLWSDLVPWILAGILLTAGLEAIPNDSELRSMLPAMERALRTTQPWQLVLTSALGAILGALLYGFVWGAAWLFSFSPDFRIEPDATSTPRSTARFEPLAMLGWVVAGAIFGAVAAFGFGLFEVYGGVRSRFGSTALVVLGVPWIIVARLSGEIVFAAITVSIDDSDSNLEWLSRSGGIYALAALAWLFLFGVVAFGPYVMGYVFGTYLDSGSTLYFGGSGVAGVLSAFLGESAKTSAKPEIAGKVRRFFTLDRLAGLGALLFGLGLILGCAELLDRFVFFDVLSCRNAGSNSSTCRFIATHFQCISPNYWIALYVAAALIVFAVASSYFVNINRFSLHGLYRNRLVRTFLGASRTSIVRAETRDPFSDYDSGDNVLLDDLWFPGQSRPGNPLKGRFAQQRANGEWLPLHIVNVALNLTSSRNLAWQERKAASFTMSPLHAGCGGKCLAPHGTYRSTRSQMDHPSYGGNIGLTLGTAMAISGAAVSPSMGYYSSPGVSFLMTLFNVRLGWWLGNPCKGPWIYAATGPRFALWPIFSEMFGLTNERAGWIYLSDGGHFDNLGLYEMVRRRCRSIVVVDAGADPDFKFQDLGNALRKIWIDLGVRVTFRDLDQLKARFKERPSPASISKYWAVGTIHYKDADGNNVNDGLILYFKASLHGNEPIDALSYGFADKSFPNDSTANQFFAESQLESYRSLGFEITDRALKCAGIRGNLYDVIDALKPAP
jgi:hypothetical protein